MSKTMDYISLCCWTVCFIIGVVGTIMGHQISNLCYIFATLVCILNYAEKVWG